MRARRGLVSAPFCAEFHPFVELLLLTENFLRNVALDLSRWRCVSAK